MSAYKHFKTIQFASADLLVKALAELGFQAKVGVSLPLHGYQGDIRKQRAQIVVDRRQIGTASNDLGFVWNGAAFEPIISAFDARQNLNEAWRQKLQATYSKLAVFQFLASKGASVSQVNRLEDGSIVFQAEVEVQW